MTKETFFDQLTTRYREDLETIIEESHIHSVHLDVLSLNGRLQSLPCSKVYELSEEDWLDLIFEVKPDLYNNLDFGIIAA